MDPNDLEGVQRRAMARLGAKAAEAEAKATDRYWQNGPYNVQAWVAKAFHASIAFVARTAPAAAETRAAYVARLYDGVRALRDDGPDADDEAWYAGAIDEAARLVTDE
jgi:hypothetical protein